MKAATGLCIKTNVDVQKRTVISIAQLTERFFSAICCRAQYIYTRITFPTVDPMAHFFTASITLAQLGGKDKGGMTMASLAEMTQARRLDEKSITEYEKDGDLRYDVVKQVYSMVESADIPQLGTRISTKQVVRDFHAYLGKRKGQKAWFMDAIWLMDHTKSCADKEMIGFYSALSLRTFMIELRKYAGLTEKELNVLSDGKVSHYCPNTWKVYLEKEKKKKDKNKKKEVDKAETPPVQEPQEDDESNPLDKGVTARVVKNDYDDSEE